MEPKGSEQFTQFLEEATDNIDAGDEHPIINKREAEKLCEV